MPDPGKFKVGFFGIGLDTYWPQFEGLKERLEGYMDIVVTQLKSFHPQVVNAGLVDTADKAFEAGSLFRQEDVSIVFLYTTTYALSAMVLPVVQWLHVPVIILNLSPADAIDYRAFNQLTDRTKMTGE